MAYKEDMWFPRYLSLWDCQGSGINARYEFRRSMVPNSLWKYPCAKGNLRYITLNSTILEIDTQWNLNKLLDQANHQQSSWGNVSNLTLAPRPFLVSKGILRSSSGKLFSTLLALRDAEDTHWGRVQLFPADHIRNYDFVPWLLSFGNTFPKHHGLYKAEMAY